ncbi:MAG TPA: 16S rRNA (guanine(527)-N(7))-methyltransferase RsmG [Pyrinomonadaceae bacterium]|nr:16S rRNA (guanine(527)-N(7))-methyltransferase RsmG [Pyrinomonadaceae bacterium]
MNRFQQFLKSNMGAFKLDLSPETLEQLGAFYSLLTRWNDRLHLVAPCSPEEFATRHVLESLMLLKHLPQDAKIADIGSGAGLPIIPCLLARPDLEATLIESSQKKSVFLREALNQLGRPSVIIPKPFEEVEPPDVSFVTCRALDQFTNKVSTLINWAAVGSTLLFYGGASLLEELRKAEVKFEQELIPLSEKRFLFVISPQS